ncbi:MAG: ABC transporter substrate-binding protein [Candidatus Latescibacteria bacterium]|nr:ABC transporter substrate-binding protein [Candidatus Latescibacterota bacterium]
MKRYGWLGLLWAGLAWGQPVVDDLGVALELKEPPGRLVSLAPSNTELLFALGLGDKVAGVTDYCNYPPEAQKVPKVAGYSTLSLEKIIAVAPDLVLAARGNDLEGIAALRVAGIPVFSLDIQSVEGLIESTGRVGQLVGAREAAARLQGEWRERVARVRARVDSSQVRPRVMWGYFGEPVYTAGAGTLIDDLISVAGGVNVGRRASGAWPPVSLETILFWAPEVLLAAAMADDQAVEKELARLRELEGWNQIPAVRQGRVYQLNPDWLTRPGPRALLALEQLAELLHPAADKP